MTDVGLVRQNNEDSLIVAPEIGLFGVCDGLGGHAAGEVASEIASRTLVEWLAANPSPPQQALKRGIDTANERILREQATNPNHRGMGTTLSAIWMAPAGAEAWIAHIGDSRIYRLRDNRLTQLTEDHSPVFRLHKQGALTKDQMLQHPQKNLLDRSLGIVPTVEPDIFPAELRLGDRILVCTDGLTDILKDREIEWLLQTPELEEATRLLLDQAKEKGGFDNISLAVVEIAEVDLKRRGTTDSP